LARAWHAAIALLAAFALVGQAIQILHNGGNLANFFSYFTIESNLLVMIAAVLIALRPDRGGTAFGILRLAGLVGITITGIIFGTILAGSADISGWAWWFDKIFHYVVPAMAVIGFVFLRPRTRLDKSAMWFVLWAFAWLAYTLIRGGVSHPGFLVTNTRTSDFPYDFLDYDRHGGGSVAVVSVAVTILALALAWAYVRLGQRSAGSATAA
jgi:hypothetical protein